MIDVNLKKEVKLNDYVFLVVCVPVSADCVAVMEGLVIHSLLDNSHDGYTA